MTPARVAAASGPTARLAAWLEEHSRQMIAGTLIVTALLAIPYFAMNPDTEASADPSGQVFDLRDDVDRRFESEIHGAGWIFESRSGDILTRDGLLEILENNRALRAADARGALAPEGLPARPYLISRFDPDTNRTVNGIDSLAEAVDEVFRADPRLPGRLAAATDEQVKLVIHFLFATPETSGLRESISVQAASKPRTVMGFGIEWWESPALLAFTLADNQKLGGGTQQIGLGADETVRDKEEFNRNVQEILRGDETHNRVWGIAIDVTLESEDEGSVAGVFIMFTVIGAVIVVGVALRSYWAMALTGVGLGVLMVWLKGASNLAGLEGGLIIEFIVPIAMISLGVDFAVHALKRYDEEKRPGLRPRRALTVGLAGVLGALALAFASDSLAFLANTSSGIEAVIHFGIAAGIAVLSSFVVLGMVVPLAMMEIDLAREARPQWSGRAATVLSIVASVNVAVLSGTAVVFTVARGVIPNGVELVILALTLVLHLALPYLWIRRRPKRAAAVAAAGAGGAGDFRDNAEPGPMVRVLVTLAQWRYAVLPAAVAVTAAAAFFALRLEATFDVKDFFVSDSDFVVSLDKLDEHVAEREGEPAIIYLRGDFTDPQALLAIDRFVRRLGDNPHVARDTAGAPNLRESIVPLTRRLTENDYARGQVEQFTGVTITDADGDGLPDDRSGQAAVLDYAVANGVPQGAETLVQTAAQVAEYVDYPADGTHTTILTAGIPGTRRQEVVKAARDLINRDFAIFDETPSVTFAGLTGSPFVRQAQLEATTDTLQRSIPIAAGGALLLLLLVMRSVRYAVVTVIPIGLVVAWLYAIMWAGGFAFNFVTATIGAVSIGVGIDYSIHMTERFREEIARSASRREALVRAANGTGVALAGSAASSIVGFAILGFAPMPMFSSYGFLTAIMIALALAASLVVLPSLLMLVTPEKRQSVEASTAVGARPVEAAGR